MDDFCISYLSNYRLIDGEKLQSLNLIIFYRRKIICSINEHDMYNCQVDEQFYKKCTNIEELINLIYNGWIDGWIDEETDRQIDKLF